MREDRVDDPVRTQRVWAVSDPHGHRAELVAALQAHGLLDERADWAAGDATLWFLGDLFDRGPDGIGIVELVMRLQQQAADEGGRVGAVLGNHEVLALGMHRFGELRAAEVDPSVMEVQMTWLRNGGVVDDQLRLGDQHLQWLSTLPSVALQGDQLLLHSDSLRYLTYGDSIERDQRIGHLSARWRPRVVVGLLEQPDAPLRLRPSRWRTSRAAGHRAARWPQGRARSQLRRRPGAGPLERGDHALSVRRGRSPGY